MNFVIIILVAIAGLFLFYHCFNSTQKGLEARLGFSPQSEISDAEFCAMMPDIDPQIALKVRDVCADVASWNREAIHPHTRLVEFELW